MKMIFFADRLPPLIGGMETHAHYFVKYFKDRYELFIISRLEDKDVWVDDEYRYIKHILLDDFLQQFQTEKTVLFFNSGRWIEKLRHIRFMLPLAIMIYRTGGNEIIQSSLMLEMPDYADRQKYWRDTINSSIDYLITNSNYTEQRLKTFGIQPSILRRIAGGVDSDTMYEAMERRLETREYYGIKQGDCLCVSCARFVPYKRVDFLIRALAVCKHSITLLLAGDGPLEEEMKELAKKQDYKIRFLGKLSQKDAVNLIASADVYVQASTELEKKVPGGKYIHTEGMGRSLLESICLGVPVVITECGAVSEYIDGENGMLVHTQEEMAAAVDCILDRKESLIENKENYISRYSFEKIFKEYITLWN